MENLAKSMEELKGHEQADIILPNNSTNQTFVDSDQTIRISFDDNEVFTGTLKAFDITATQIKCVLYNAVFEAMKAKTITADYSSGAPANTIFAAICTAAGVTAGSCPTTTINVNFIDAECYMAAVFLSDVCNSDYSASSGTFNIAARGSLKTASHFKIQSRGIDRAKKRDKVRVRGVSIAGLPIFGEAGSGTNVVVKIEQKVSDVGSLSLLAAKYLADLNTDSKGAPLIFPITEAYGFHPGDTFAVTNLRYKLDGTYAMKRVTKTATKVTAELDVAKTTIEQMLLDFDKYAEYGIYYTAGGFNPTVLNYQGLELFQLMNEGADVFITDYSSKWRQGIGNGITWTPSLNGLACTFEGAGYIMSGCDWSLAGTDQFTLSVWLNPETISNTEARFIAILPNNFLIMQTLAELQVGIYTGEGSTFYELDIANAFEVGVRKHLVITYDGANLKVYLNAKLAGSLAVTGNFSPFNSVWELCVGSLSGLLGYVGQMDTLLIFSRTVAESEIADLYRFGNIIVPPTQPASNTLNTYNLAHHFHMNEGPGATAIRDVNNVAILGAIHSCFWQLGESSPELEFLSGSSVTLPSLEIGGTDMLSIGFWVTPEAVQSNGIVFSKDSEVEFRVEGGSALFRFWVGSIMTGVGTSQFLIVPGKKYFIMATYDGSTARIYVNGTERARQFISGDIDTGTAPIYLGGSDASGTDGFHGVISELMIWRG